MNKNYNSTLARVAGNLMSGWLSVDKQTRAQAVYDAVATAREIVAEIERTEPAQEAEGRPTS